MIQFKEWLVPDEWRSAYGTLRDLQASAFTTVRSHVRHIVGYVVLWSAGSVCGLYVWRILYAAAIDAGSADSFEGLMRTVLTMASVLSGFVIALMLFTGKTEAWKSLSLEQGEAFAGKASYLMLSQFVTLTNHVIVICFALIWFVVSAAGSLEKTQLVFAALVGFLGVSAIRTFLIPLQIAELHRFALHVLLEEKSKESQSLAGKLRNPSS